MCSGTVSHRVPSGNAVMLILKVRNISTCSCGISKASIIAPAAAPKSQPIDDAKAIEALKEYKDLLDSGIITQEEFDAKKKNLLGL